MVLAIGKLRRLFLDVCKLHVFSSQEFVRVKDTGIGFVVLLSQSVRSASVKDVLSMFI